MSTHPLRAGVMCTLAVLPALSQGLNPVINPRGIINAFSQQPAPSQVAQGGIIWINGISLGPASGATGEGPVFPTELGDLQVLIAGRAAPLISADPSRIVAQVPYETPAGLQAVVVRRGTAESRPARINVLANLPVVATTNDKGFGELATTVSAQRLTFRASGLGPTEPRTGSGELGASGALPRLGVEVTVGGMPVTADLQPSSKLPGVFDITVELPANTQPGDLVTLNAGNRLANLATWQPLTRAEVSFVAMPAGVPEVRGLAGSDLRGGFLIASAARTDDGCWPSVLFDIRANKATALKECLTAANRNAATPAVSSVNGSAIAALVGPPQGDGTPNSPGVSNKLAVFRPSTDSGRMIDLPFTATQLLSIDSNTIGALAASNPPQIATVETTTGNVSTGAAGAPFAGLGAGAGGGGGQGQNALNFLNLEIDLGGGLNKLLSAPVGSGPGQLAVVVGDDENNPKRAKLAILNQQGEVTSQRDFAEGWLPMVMPNAPAQPAGGGGGLPGGGLPGGPGGGFPGGPGGGLPGGGVIIGAPGGAAVTPVRFRVSTYFDTQTRTLYVISRKADDSAHGLMAFAPESVRAVPAPSGTFIAGCAPNAQILTIDTSRRIAVLGTNVAEREYKQICGALSFLVYDLGAASLTNVPIPGSGQVNATNAAFDINDFILAANTAGDTVYALDGVTLATYRFDLPQGVVGFANLITAPEMELAIATGRSRQNGDAGFLIFDLQNIETRQLLLPDGFTSVQMVGLLPATRKLIAKGNRANGSQFLIYDLLNGDVQFVDNPPNVAFVGNAPAAQPQQQTPVLQRVNTKANTIEAITYGADRRPNGAMLVRVP